MIANILVPLDGSPLAERALPYATALARVANARLRLLQVMPDVPEALHPWKAVDVAARLEQIATELRASGIQATEKTVVGYPTASAILAAASDPPADLIVMSTHGRSGLGRWLYGAVADRVVSLSDVPVLLISAACHQPWPTDRPLKILVPLDGSDYAEAALGPARVLSHSLGASLLLMRVAEQDATMEWRFDPAHLAMRAVSPTEMDQAEQYLTGLAQQPGEAAPAADTLVDAGEPSVVIAATAEREGADLIVMATHGRTGLARLTMGSVATRTLQRAHVPILLVRPPGLERPAAEPAEHTPAESVPEAWPPVGTH